VAARAAARCAQCGDAAEECGRGESEVEDEKEGSDSELRALKVVAVVKEEVEAEAVELRFLMQFVHPVTRIVVQVMEQTAYILILLLSDYYAVPSAILEVHPSQH